MIPMSDHFYNEHQESGYEPVFLAELNGINRHYASRDPGFTGPRRAGQGIVAGTGAVFGDEMPTYETSLKPLRESGVGNIQYQLDQAGFARTGQSSLSFLNQNFLNKVFHDLELENCSVVIRLGFYGGEHTDYIPIFRGAIDSTSATVTSVEVELIDDTLNSINPVPPKTGIDFIQNSFTKDAVIPIVLGDVEYVPTIRTVGPITVTLSSNAFIGNTVLYYHELDASLPATGTVNAGGDDLEYLGHDTISTAYGVFGRIYLAVALTADILSGAAVTLVNSPASYLFGFAGKNPRRIRQSVTAPTTAPEVRTYPLATDGTDHRRVHTVDFEEEQDSITATLAGEGRGDNLVPNGNFNSSMGDWQVTSGTWAVVTPSDTFDPVLQGSGSGSGTAHSAYVDMNLDYDVRYRLTFLATNLTAETAEVLIGTAEEPDVYFTFANILPTDVENLYDVTFVVGSEDATRITLVINRSSESNVVFFDQFDLYNLATETPAVQISELIATHMPQLKIEPYSFEEAQDLWLYSGDRCAGLVQEGEESQALLGRIAQQFRAKTFLNENSEQVLRVFDASAIPVRNFNMRTTYKGSMSVGKNPLTEIYTNYYVYYGRAPLNQLALEAPLGKVSEFEGVVFATPTGTNHSGRVDLPGLCRAARNKFRIDSTQTVLGDFIPDRHTAEATLAYLVHRGTHQRTAITFTTFLTGSPINIGDLITVDHVLFPDLAGLKFEVESKDLSPNGCMVTLHCEHIAPFKFGAYEEHWEFNNRRRPYGFPTRRPLDEMDDEYTTFNEYYYEDWEEF